MDAIISAQAAVAPIEGAIRNPANPHHFMVVRPVGRRVRISVGDTMVAESENAVWVLEAGKSLYGPMVYLPTADIKVALGEMDKSSHCPLKGDAVYFSLNGEEIAWSYAKPFGFAEQLAGHLAFWPSKVRMEIG